MANNNYVVIMAGGIGSRFWPYSRTDYPKQFHDVLGMGKSLLQLTYDRFLSIAPKENIYIVSNDLYENLIKKQLPDLTDDQILLEPNRRNTAPCIAYAGYKIIQRNPDANMVVTPSDHAIFNERAFEDSIKTSISSFEQINNPSSHTAITFLETADFNSATESTTSYSTPSHSAHDSAFSSLMSAIATGLNPGVI